MTVITNADFVKTSGEEMPRTEERIPAHSVMCQVHDSEKEVCINTMYTNNTIYSLHVMMYQFMGPVPV